MDKKMTGNLGCFDAGYLSFFSLNKTISAEVKSHWNFVIVSYVLMNSPFSK